MVEVYTVGTGEDDLPSLRGTILVSGYWTKPFPCSAEGLEKSRSHTGYRPKSEHRYLLCDVWEPEMQESVTLGQSTSAKGPRETMHLPGAGAQALALP